MADPKPLAPTTWAELAQGYAMLAREVREDVRRIDARFDRMEGRFDDVDRKLGEVHTVVSEKVEEAIRAHDNEVEAGTWRTVKKNAWKVAVGVLVVALAGSGSVQACAHYRSASLPAAAP